jgi:hypothetical protein
MNGETPTAAFSKVFEAVKRVVEARGARQPGEPQVNYAEGSLTLSRAPLNEYEVRARGRVNFRARHTGALSSAPVFEPGDWVEEVRRIDRDIKRGMSR